jgi:hypothetical protein
VRGAVEESQPGNCSASGGGETQPPDWLRHRTLKAYRVRTNQLPRLSRE